MDLLITVIGNAVVHEDFRAELMDEDVNPLETIEKWGFHLTKGEGEMLTAIFRGGNKEKVSRACASLWDALHEGMETFVISVPPCRKPCMMSVGKLLNFSGNAKARKSAQVTQQQKKEPRRGKSAA